MKLFVAVILFSILGFVHAQETDCKNPVTTIEINICSAREVASAEDELERYFDKALEKYSSDVEIAKGLRISQETWLVYRRSYCDAIYDLWSGGSIRGAMYNGCMLTLTKQRTHTIWSDYLTYMDSTPALLPEPQ